MFKLLYSASACCLPFCASSFFKLNADFAQLVGYCFNAIVHCFRFGRCALLGFAVLALQVLVLLLQVAADLHILTVCERIYGYHAIASWFACQFAQFFCVYWQKPLAVAVPAMYRLRVHSGHDMELVDALKQNTHSKAMRLRRGLWRV